LATNSAYVETSVISFFHEIRAEPEMVARRRWTRDWWESSSRSTRLVSSPVVLEELTDGNYPTRDDCISLASSLPMLAVTQPVIDAAQFYIQRFVMPSSPAGDAFHLALASVYRCDFLVTWNCRHLANANKFDHIRTVNQQLDLFVPKLVTPLELLGVGPDE